MFLLQATAVHQLVQEQAGTGSPWMLSGHRVHHRLIFDNIVPFFYLLFFVAQVLIHLVTWTVVVVLNIGIDTYERNIEKGRIHLCQ
jgi:hypothetical protein